MPRLLCALPMVMVLASCNGGDPEQPPPARKSPMEGWQDSVGAGEFYRDGAVADAAAAVRGRGIVDEYRSGQRCMSCHAMPDSNSPAGPALWGVGGRYSRAFGSEVAARRWLHNKIAEPQKYPGLNTGRYPPNQMPRGAAYYTPREIADMVEYLMTLGEAG